jgi:FkbM family methyltransferase
MYNRLITLRQVASLLGVVQILRFLLTRLLGAPTLTVKLAADGAPLTIRFNNSDLVLLLGVFLHGDCHLSLQPPPALILDLGANVGLTARVWADQFPSARIVAVEPDADTYRLCMQNTAAHPGTVCLNRMVGPVAGFGAIANPGVISMARQFTALPAGTAEGIRICPVEELLDEHPVFGPILVKMDIEGAEIALFEQAGPWLGRVQAVLVEPHGAGTAGLIERTLVQHGFSLHRVGEKILGLRAPWTYHDRPNLSSA